MIQMKTVNPMDGKCKYFQYNRILIVTAYGLVVLIGFHLDAIICLNVGWGPGGWVWTNYVQGFSTSGDRDGDGVMDPKYFLHEMNLSGFTIP
jgi:hypothetical protein